MDIFAHETGTDSELSPKVETAMRLIGFARRYTLSLLEDLNEDEWFWTPDAEFNTHIGWQCGHIAMAQYGLTLYQQRGRVREVDGELMSSKFRKLFMRGTTPSPNRDDYPPSSEILDVMKRVSDQMVVEVPTFSSEDLEAELGPPHAGYNTRYGALLFAGHHEMVHAGQIGMLRRLMGKEPLR